MSLFCPPYDLDFTWTKLNLYQYQRNSGVEIWKPFMIVDITLKKTHTPARKYCSKRFGACFTFSVVTPKRSYRLLPGGGSEQSSNAHY